MRKEIIVKVSGNVEVATYVLQKDQRCTVSNNSGDPQGYLLNYIKNPGIEHQHRIPHDLTKSNVEEFKREVFAARNEARESKPNKKILFVSCINKTHPKGSSIHSIAIERNYLAEPNYFSKKTAEKIYNLLSQKLTKNDQWILHPLILSGPTVPDFEAKVDTIINGILKSNKLPKTLAPVNTSEKHTKNFRKRISSLTNHSRALGSVILKITEELGQTPVPPGKLKLTENPNKYCFDANGTKKQWLEVRFLQGGQISFSHRGPDLIQGQTGLKTEVKPKKNSPKIIWNELIPPDTIDELQLTGLKEALLESHECFRLSKPSISYVVGANLDSESDIGDQNLILEGKEVQATGTRKQRSRKARQLCIQHHGTECRVCKIDFGKVYGAKGQGYCHVHHVDPLHAIDTERAVDPVKDLVPVCPNCHAMLHTENPPIPIEDLKSEIQSNGWLWRKK